MRNKPWRDCICFSVHWGVCQYFQKAIFFSKDTIDFHMRVGNDAFWDDKIWSFFVRLSVTCPTCNHSFGTEWNAVWILLFSTLVQSFNSWLCFPGPTSDPLATLWHWLSDVWGLLCVVWYWGCSEQRWVCCPGIQRWRLEHVGRPCCHVTNCWEEMHMWPALLFSMQTVTNNLLSKSSCQFNLLSMF